MRDDEDGRMRETMKMEEWEGAGRWKSVEDEEGQSCVTACFIIVFQE